MATATRVKTNVREEKIVEISIPLDDRANETEKREACILALQKTIEKIKGLSKKYTIRTITGMELFDKFQLDIDVREIR